LKERFPNLPEESLIALQNLSTFRGTMMSAGGMPVNNNPQGIDDIINSAIHKGKKQGIIDKNFGKQRKMKAGGTPMPEVGPPVPSVGPPPDVPIKASAIGSEGQMRNGMIAGGGLASLPTEAVGNMQPSEVDIMELAQSVLGKVSENQQQAINDKFRKKYGDLAFREFRTKILRTVVPNAQTEGLIRGSGGGMDDEIYGMINDNQPVALSSGEYVIPADGVADIGDGSTEAGARRIAEAVEEKRLERHGTRKQPPETRKDKPLFA